MREHGQEKRYYHKFIGLNARMDTIQAAVLIVKLRHYQKDLELRNEVAKKYNKALKGKVILPLIKEDRTTTWAQYSIRVGEEREDLIIKLKEIPTAIHYPIPIHLQECFKYLGYEKGDFPIAERISKEIISLPMNPYLTDEEISYIIKSILHYYREVKDML